MPIERDHDERIAWLALPLAAVAGFVVFALVAAAVGAGAGPSSLTGVAGLVVGVAIAAVVLRRTRPR